MSNNGKTLISFGIVSVIFGTLIYWWFLHSDTLAAVVLLPPAFIFAAVGVIISAIGVTRIFSSKNISNYPKTASAIYICIALVVAYVAAMWIWNLPA